MSGTNVIDEDLPSYEEMLQEHGITIERIEQDGYRWVQLHLDPGRISIERFLYKNDMGSIAVTRDINNPAALREASEKLSNAADYLENNEGGDDNG